VFPRPLQKVLTMLKLHPLCRDCLCCRNMLQVLGLDGLGFKCAQSWQPHEELLFCLGM